MKVLFYYHFLGLGGVEASVLRRVIALRQNGVNAEYGFSIYYGSGAEYIGREEYVHQVDWQSDTFISLLKQYDIVVVIDFPRLITRLERFGFTKPVIFETHASYPPALEKYYSVLKSELIKAIVVPADYNKRLILECKSANLVPRVIPNCFEVDPISSLHSQPLPHAGPTILWIGRMEDEKNPLEAIEITQAVRASKKECDLLMIGDTPDYHGYLQNLLIAAKLQHHAAFLRFERRVPFENMSSIYSAVARNGGVLLSTSRFESSPMTFIEAMICRCPIVSAETGGVADLLALGARGALYELGNVYQGADKIMRLMSADASEERIAVTERAYHYALKSHSPKQISEQYMKLITELVNTK